MTENRTQYWPFVSTTNTWLSRSRSTPAPGSRSCHFTPQGYHLLITYCKQPQPRAPAATTGEQPPLVPVIRGFFYLVHVGNTGAAWSLFSGRSPVLAAFAAATLAAIFIWRRALGLRSTGAQVCFGLLCGGILGNLIDRLVHHHVIDFIDLHFGAYVYPTFNLADSGICVGVRSAER